MPGIVEPGQPVGDGQVLQFAQHPLPFPGEIPFSQNAPHPQKQLLEPDGLEVLQSAIGVLKRMSAGLEPLLGEV